MKPIPFVRRFSFKVIAGVISMLILVGIPFFFIFLRYYRSQLLETMEQSTTLMSRVLAQQLEVSVLEGRHHDLEQVIERLSARGNVRQIMIIDSKEVVKVSSEHSMLGRKLQRNTEPGCRECHTAMVIKDTIYMDQPGGKSFYRNVNVIQNKQSCQACHNPNAAVNGILVMDFSQDNLVSQLRTSSIQLVGMGAAMLLLTVVVLSLLLNRLVLRRLRTLATAADQIGQARFERVHMPGRDEFSQLAGGFNLMSERLSAAMRVIRESKEYLEGVINNIDDEIVVIDREGLIVTANAAFFRNRQVATRLILEDACARWRGESAEAADESECSSCASRLTFQDGQTHKVLRSFVDHQGKERFVEAFACPLRNERGDVYQVIEVRRDITERRALEANLAHSERLVSMGLLASGLAHEINNPLASISTFMEGLKRRLTENGGQSAKSSDNLPHSLDLILREIDRAKDVTRRLLVLAQREDSCRSLVDLNGSLSETVALIRYEASERGIQVHVQSDPAMPTLRKSESQIRQVFLNLLLNSLQAGRPGGNIWCRTWHDNGSVFASISDDGEGINATDLPRIFEPFYSTKGPGQGTGLGLFISKSLISAMGGDLTVESSLGQGAKFTLMLPAEP